MKPRTLTYIIAMAMFTVPAVPVRSAAQDYKGHGGYTVTNLGTLGGTSSLANSINDEGWVAGQANLQGNQTAHAVLWQRNAEIEDLGTLGGPNSGVYFPVKDDIGLIVGVADTSNPDPLQEDFCSFASDGYSGNYLCLGFAWQGGTMTPLPTLGGNNSYATAANNWGQVVGLAENSTHDLGCIPPQVFDWEAVIWGPKPGEINELPPFSGDAVAGALAVNDRGQVVGGSGICGPVSSAVSLHAVLWRDGSVSDLGNLGGVMNNVASGINNRGEVIGLSDLAGDATFHTFLWTEDKGMQDLGTLPGDILSSPQGINYQGEVVGTSCDASGNCRAFLWQDGVMTDLNTLVCPGTSLYLTQGYDINDRGEIVGEAYDSNTGETPAFQAVPSDRGEDCEANSSPAQKVVLPENVREKLRQRRGFGRLGAGLMSPQ